MDVKYIDCEPFWLSDPWKTPNTYDSKRYANVPNKSGVYLIIEYVIKSDAKYKAILCYIGSSTNLSGRFKTHEVIKKITDCGNLYQFYFREIEFGFYDKEIELIKTYTPPYNKSLYGAKRNSLVRYNELDYGS